MTLQASVYGISLGMTASEVAIRLGTPHTTGSISVGSVLVFESESASPRQNDLARRSSARPDPHLTLVYLTRDSAVFACSGDACSVNGVTVQAGDSLEVLVSAALTQPNR